MEANEESRVLAGLRKRRFSLSRIRTTPDNGDKTTSILDNSPMSNCPLVPPAHPLTPTSILRSHGRSSTGSDKRPSPERSVKIEGQFTMRDLKKELGLSAIPSMETIGSQEEQSARTSVTSPKSHRRVSWVPGGPPTVSMGTVTEHHVDPLELVSHDVIFEPEHQVDPLGLVIHDVTSEPANLTQQSDQDDDGSQYLCRCVVGIKRCGCSVRGCC